MESPTINCNSTEQLTTDYSSLTSEQMIVATLNLFCGEGITEIRCLDAGGRKKKTDSGYFDDFGKASKFIQQYVQDKRTKGVYFVLNEVPTELLARAANRFEEFATVTTSDKVITSRRWLHVDCDPIRPSGISSTNQQVQQSIERAAGVAEWMRSQGLCEPITAMSGNGAHLHFPICLPNDPDSLALIAGVLGTLKAMFSDDAVSINTTVSNAAGICRLYGTIARMGDSTEDRPHRMARLLSVPDYLRHGTGEVCNVDALRAVAAMSDETKSPNGKPVVSTSQPETSGMRPRVLLDAYLQDNGIEFKIEPDGDVTKYMIECPFNPEHTSAYIGQFDSGAVFFKCSDNSCVNKNWQSVKRKLGKPKGIHYDPPKKDRREKEYSRPVAGDGQELPATGERSYDNTDLNDIGNAQHYATNYENDLRYCAAWKKWLVWDGCRWKIDDEGRPLKLAKELVHTMFNDAIELRGGEVFKHVCETARLSRLNALITLAGPELPIRVDELDQDGWILNCRNGVVDLKSGELKPHDRTKGITKLCPTEFNLDAESPVWNQFLHDVFNGDKDLISFVQRLFGYYLSGDVSEQKLALFYGTGANGKSTLLNAFMDTIGPDYTMQSMPDFLMEKKIESHPTEKASLFGKRFVSCVETDASRKLAESTVKMLTGGERIMARRMKEDFWEFDPTHKLVLCTNHKPIISGTDHGMWRRLLLVPFLQRFDGERQDKQLPEKLKAESAGILAWAVRGCLEWQRIGLNPPASVTGATEDYRSSEDIFGRFIADCCVVTKAGAVPFKHLYARLEQWTNDGGDFLPNKKAVGIWLEENGFEKYSANGRHYRGLMLRETSSEVDIEDPFLRS